VEENLQGSKTEANLIKWWKAKSVEKMKVTLYQQQAGREAFRQLSLFLGEYATNHYVHAANCHGVLWGPYTDMEKNLEALINQEHDHAQKSFPEYARVAREEGFDEIAQMFEAIAKVDAAQEEKYSDILDKIRSDKIFTKDTAQDWYCSQCGNTHSAISAPEECPLCKMPKRYFEIKGANFSTF